MENFYNMLIEYKEALTVLIGIYFFIRKVYLQMKVAKKEEKYWVILNALKDENKMVEGKQFTNDFYNKIEKVAEALGATQGTIKEARKNIHNINEGEGIIKIGTDNGKPLYLDKMLQEAGKVRKVFKLFKGIF